MRHREEFGRFGFVLAALGGVLTGAALALLVAPNRGSETRQKLKEIASASTRKLRRVRRTAAEGVATGYEGAHSSI